MSISLNRVEILIDFLSDKMPTNLERPESPQFNKSFKHNHSWLTSLGIKCFAIYSREYNFSPNILLKVNVKIRSIKAGQHFSIDLSKRKGRGVEGE